MPSRALRKEMAGELAFRRKYQAASANSQPQSIADKNCRSGSPSVMPVRGWQLGRSRAPFMAARRTIAKRLDHRSGCPVAELAVGTTRNKRDL